MNTIQSDGEKTWETIDVYHEWIRLPQFETVDEVFVVGDQVFTVECIAHEMIEALRCVLRRTLDQSYHLPPGPGPWRIERQVHMTGRKQSIDRKIWSA